MKPLTKSLHTVTAVKNVATYLYIQGNRRLATSEQLVSEALGILGYPPKSYAIADVTVQRCIDAVSMALIDAGAR